MAAALSKHKNPINIAPLVDVLLILFVILVVAARFDVSEETKQLKVELNNTKTVVEASKDAAKLKELLSKVNKLESENEKLKKQNTAAKAETIEKAPKIKATATASPAPAPSKESKEDVALLKKEIESLKEKLRMTMSSRLQVIIDIEDDAIYFNEKRVSLEQAKLIFDAVAPRHYKLNWNESATAKAKADELQKYLFSKGYELEK
jgi:biopolymer transport protein ExbD